MLKELIEIFSECEQMKKITPCSSALEFETVALMPQRGELIKKYTDGKALLSANVRLLYKLPFSPAGDKGFMADTFYETVSLWLQERFKKDSVFCGKYEFTGIDIPLNYVLQKKTPSTAIYSLEITINYLRS